MKKKLLIALSGCALLVAAVPAFGATRTIRVDDNVFEPRTADVRRGTTVRFRWVGSAPHNVVVARGPVKFSSAIKRSGSYRKKITRRGTYRIICTIHPQMKLTLRAK